MYVVHRDIHGGVAVAAATTTTAALFLKPPQRDSGSFFGDIVKLYEFAQNLDLYKCNT
jgi:hypothetical protein